MTRLLWADDDSKGALEAFEQRLEANGFLVRTAVNYEQAVKRLRRDSKLDALLLDIILPERSTLADPYPGLRIAEEALSLENIKSVVFLTVVRRERISARLERIERGFSLKGSIPIYDKAELLEPQRQGLLFSDLKSEMSIKAKAVR